MSILQKFIDRAQNAFNPQIISPLQTPVPKREGKSLGDILKNIRGKIGNAGRTWSYAAPNTAPSIVAETPQKANPMAGLGSDIPKTIPMTHDDIQRQRVQSAMEVMKDFRNPLWNKWRMQNPKRYAEVLSGTKLASEKYGVPRDLLMDISGIETSGGQFLDQLSGGPGQGYFMFEPGQRMIPHNFNPYSATESAMLAADWIKRGMLSRWGLPQKLMTEKLWGSLDNPNNSNGMITNWYTPEELNPYLAPDYRF